MNKMVQTDCHIQICRYIRVNQSGLYSAVGSLRLEEFIGIFLPIERNNNQYLIYPNKSS